MAAEFRALRPGERYQSLEEVNFLQRLPKLRALSLSGLGNLSESSSQKQPLSFRLFISGCSRLGCEGRRAPCDPRWSSAPQLPGTWTESQAEAGKTLGWNMLSPLLPLSEPKPAARTTAMNLAPTPIPPTTTRPFRPAHSR